MTPDASTGKCALCGATVSKKEMTKHLKACLAARQPEPNTAMGKKPRRTTVFHLLVEGQYAPQYWLHVGAKTKARLDDLDGFLRDIWLECCGHLSEFKIGKTRHSSYSEDDFDDEGMDASLEDVLPQGKFFHDYDFGTTTHLALKVLGMHEAVQQDKVILLARNDPPVILCDCGKPAEWVCGECIWDGKGWLCADCARKHKCESEGFLPVVNSPRVGQCGYTGDAEYGYFADAEDESEDGLEDESEEDSAEETADGQ